MKTARLPASGGGAPSGGVSDVTVQQESIVGEDGKAVIPLYKGHGKYGLVRTSSYGGGLSYSSSGALEGSLVIEGATRSMINSHASDALQNWYAPITLSNLDYAVKQAMCDGKGDAWTDDEKTGAWSRLNSIKTTMDDVAVAGAQYYLGEQTEVSIVLPDTAEVGQIVSVSWYNGDAAATLSITGTMLDFDYTPSANTRSEINALWDGTYWDVLWHEMAVV